MARHKRKKIDQLKTQVWYEFVRVKLCLNTAYQLDKAFGTDENGNWYKYKRGLRVPTKGTLAAVERYCPGSRVIFDKGPNDASLWSALVAPHTELWDIIDITFPKFMADRKMGIFGLLQYKHYFNKLLVPDIYLKYIDYIAYAKGLQPNSVRLAFSRGEILISGRIVASVIAYWRLCSLVMFDMVSSDYLLNGILIILKDGRTISDDDQTTLDDDPIFSVTMDKLIAKYMINHLQEE